MARWRLTVSQLAKLPLWPHERSHGLGIGQSPLEVSAKMRLCRARSVLVLGLERTQVDLFAGGYGYGYGYGYG
jgi:hypothetical protein